MTLTPDNRMGQQFKRKQGRPPDSEPKHQPQAAIVDLSQAAVPPMVCPLCGRGMTPRIERRRTNGDADCKCGINGCRFLYQPARVIPRR